MIDCYAFISHRLSSSDKCPRIVAFLEVPKQISNPRIVLLTIYQLERIAKFIHDAQRERMAFQILNDTSTTHKFTRPKQTLCTNSYHQLVATPERPIFTPSSWS